MSPAIRSPASAGPCTVPREPRSPQNSPLSIFRSVPGPWPVSCGPPLSLRVNHKRVSAGSGPYRDTAVHLHRPQRDKYAARGLPIVSIDAKKRELVGNKNPGRGWAKTPIQVCVNDHDFRSQRHRHPLRHLRCNRRWLRRRRHLATTPPTSLTDILLRSWQREGCQRTTSARELLVLADSGGSNAARSPLLQVALQTPC